MATSWTNDGTGTRDSSASTTTIGGLTVSGNTTLGADVILTTGVVTGTIRGSAALVIAGTSTLQSTAAITGLLTATAGIKLGNNIIYASDGGASITIDADDNMVVGGKITATTGLEVENNIIYNSASEATLTMDTDQNVTIGSSTSGTLKVCGNAIKASDNGTPILWDTDDNVTINGDLAVTGGDITSSSGAINFGNENLSTTGWMAIGVATRIGSETLRLDGANPSVLMTSSSADGEGGEYKLRGTSGGDDYSDFYGVMDMYQNQLRLMFETKGAAIDVEQVFRVIPLGTSSNPEYCNIEIQHLGSSSDGGLTNSGKIVLKGSTGTAAGIDHVAIGEGGNHDQLLVWHNAGSARYMGIDDSDSEKLKIGRGGVMGTTPSVQIDASDNVELTADLTITGGDVVAGVNSTTRGTLSLWDGGSGNTPGYLVLYSPNGTANYIFCEDDGTLKRHTSAPSANGDGSEIGNQS
jgi:hypothetical protein